MGSPIADHTDLNWMPATSLAKLIGNRSVSPVDVMQAVLDTVARHEPRVNAFVHLAADAAMEAARRAERDVMSGAVTGPLHGIPITIKDTAVDVGGMPTRSGSLTREVIVATMDAPAVARLRRAGAIVIGKTTTSEYGWTGVSRSPVSGETHNPWRHGYNAGASSAGAAAAAAAGFGPLHLGSDGAGSIRMPAHFCGVYGLKPSFGRVPYAPLANGDLTSHLGPLTRTVSDAALMLQVMAGPSSLDHTSLETGPAAYPDRLLEAHRPFRVAYSPDLGHARVDPEVAALVREAAEEFAAAAGTKLVELTPEWGPRGPALGRFFWSANLARLAPLLDRATEMDPGLVACIKDGMVPSLTEYLLMRAEKYSYIRAIHSFFDDYDVLLTPAVSVAAFPLPLLQPADWPQHAWDWMSWAEFSYPFNHAGNPSASIPCGFTSAGLPVGLQITGRRFDDLGVLQASALFEQARPWAGRRPPL